MLKNYDKKLILFSAGTSGHFLANFLSTTPNQINANFRIDWQQKNLASDFLGGVESNSLTNEQFCSLFDKWVKLPDTHTAITHYLGISNLLKYNELCWIRKIVSKNFVLNHCKNVYFKKQEVEFITYSRATMPKMVDSMIMNIADFYNSAQQDHDLPNGYLIEFGKLVDIDYLIELYVEANGAEPTNDKIQWAKEYISKQYKLYEYPTTKDMGEIIKIIDPQDPFDIAAVLFTYENNWNTLDSNRLWSINNFPDTVEESKNFLLRNAHNYTFFKEEESC